MSHSIFIAKPPQAVFDYVTQPWLWHQWHPNSKSAQSQVERLQLHDEFDEIIELKPLSWLPIKLTRQTHYKVEESVPGERWQVRGKGQDGWLELRYRIRPDDKGSYFVRDLTFEMQGLSRLLMHALHKQMQKTSVLALNNLKCQLERDD